MAIFLGVKAYEYNQKFVEHIVPGLDWAPEGAVLTRLAPGGVEHAELYFIFYFAMTGLHAVHMIIGMGLLLWLVLRGRKGNFTPHYFAPVEVVGLYWHFVDIVWIFLFPVALFDWRTLLMSQQIVPVKTYVFVFASLIGLTLLTTGVAFIDLGPFNTVAALAIAFAKMLLVVLFFMHLRHSCGLMRVVVVAAFFWLALLIVPDHE